MHLYSQLIFTFNKHFFMGIHVFRELEDFFSHILECGSRQTVAGGAVSS